MNYYPTNINNKFELFSEQWQPKVIATMNDYELAQNQYKCWLKNTMGYRGIGSSGINSGLCSRNALELKYKFGKDYKYDVSDDHVLGATLIGETVEKAIEMSNWNPKLLIKEGWFT